ncbi:MAG TPA: fasciclin domain-containing protein [Kofleriaceae bacterium]|nr:fasciclin domain-containing protein [Kofleriaceae bacterium]
MRAREALVCRVLACGKKDSAPAQAAAAVEAPVAPSPPQTPPLDPNNIVSIAVGSKDHTTLVTALKAADYVTAVANPGPLTVFAPTNDAFAKLPKGTIEDLVKRENVDKLKNVLEYGDDLAMSNGAHATIPVKDGVVMINDATIIASVRASNGVVHVIDTVLVPPSK